MIISVGWLTSLLVAGTVGASMFEQAQQAAGEGRYEDVIVLLSKSIEDKTLADRERAIALSNRGIAYSLLKQYAPAQRDLRAAIEINPEYPLTLNHLGILAEHIEGDYGEAAQWYAKAVALSYPASLVNLGNLYRDGRGVDQDLGVAAQLYQQAVELDYLVAGVALGELYLEGQGVPQDFDKALLLLNKAADADVVTAHFPLGRAYEKDLGVAQNYGEALKHYRKAALRGHAPSQGALGYLIRKGYGTPKDFVEAAKWYGLAAEQDDVTAANRLAWIMAGCPIQEVCNGNAAVELAEMAVAYRRSASNLDTLAAAYARRGEFDRAQTIINEILEKELSDQSHIRFTRRLERYRNGIPYQL